MSHEHILRGQLRIPFVPADLSTYPAAYGTDGSAGTTCGGLFLDLASALF